MQKTRSVGDNGAPGICSDCPRHAHPATMAAAVATKSAALPQTEQSAICAAPEYITAIAQRMVPERWIIRMRPEFPCVRPNARAGPERQTTGWYLISRQKC